MTTMRTTVSRERRCTGGTLLPVPAPRPPGPPRGAGAAAGRHHRFASIALTAPRDVMQLKLKWDWRQRLAATAAALGSGAAAIGGGALMFGAATLAAPVALAAGAATAIGAGAYLGYRHATHPVTRLRQLHAQLGPHENVLNHVLTNTLARADDPTVDVHESGSAYGGGETQRLGGGRHATLLDQSIDVNARDPVVAASKQVHELTHVEADRRYQTNQRGDPQQTFFNISGHNPSDPEIGRQAAALNARVNRTIPTVQADNAIPINERNYILGRLNYIGGKPHQEFDTVVNELLVYMRLRNLRQNSNTYQMIAALARRAARRRGP